LPRAGRLLAAVLLVAFTFTPPAGAQPSAAPDEDTTVEEHLEQALDYLAEDDYVGARLEFETVLRLDELPPGPEEQAKIYEKLAREYLAGQRVLWSGYALIGLGHYRENSTSAGDGDTSDNFTNPRIGGRMNYLFGDGYAIDGTLDYRFRYYDNSDRRNDSDLRWSGDVSRTIDDHNIAVGVRGRVSYRGDSDYRNDYGVFGNWRVLIDDDNQVRFGAEFRRRAYPSGRLRDRTRNIAELTAAWTRSFREGRANLTIAAQGGREYGSGRIDGSSNFYGLSPSYDFTITDAWSGFVFAWWQNDRFSVERLNAPDGDDAANIGTRNDNLYEVGGGVVWAFAERWTFNPEILYIRDQSNILGANYSSTEVWATIRKGF
jgi:hypothetical protein